MIYKIHKTKIYIHILSFVVIVLLVSTVDAVKNMTQLPSNSVAASDGALATFFNPAGVACRSDFELCYLRTYDGSSKGDDALFVAAAKSGLGLEFIEMEDDVSFKRYTVTNATRLLGSLYLGTSYSWINASLADYGRFNYRNYDNFSSWSMGLMFRRNNLSIGTVARDLNRPILVGGRTYDFGIALRPNTSRITFSLDLRKVENTNGIEIRYGLDIRPMDFLTFRSGYWNDKNFDIRFGVNLGYMGLGAFRAFLPSKKLETGVGEFRISQLSRTKSRRKIFLDIEMSEINYLLQIVKDDPSVVGVLVRIGGSDVGVAQMQERRNLLKQLVDSGKEVICYGKICSTGAYLLASASSQIFFHPLGTLDLVGVRSEPMFLRPLMDKLGVHSDFERIGEYKSATERFARSEMSEVYREQTNNLIDDIYNQIIQMIAEGRNWVPKQVEGLVDKGPFTAKQALENQLVDKLVYEDEIEELIGRRKSNLVKGDRYFGQVYHEYNWRIGVSKIAVIHAVGDMITGKSFANPFTGGVFMGSDTITGAIRSVREDNSIKAVVLRIDSGGGFVLAADEIWRELQLLKQVGKPLIVSMGDTAASGGYYIATLADQIIAEPSTVTGSIGVFTGRLNLKRLYDKIGIKKEIIKRGKNADFYSDYSDYSETHRQAMRASVEEIYDGFVAKVADGRGMTKEEVDQVARGRVWTGRQAHKIGLVDQLGGLDLALSVAREKAGLMGQQVELVSLPQATWLYGLLNNILSLDLGVLDIISRQKQVSQQLSRDRVFLMASYNLHVRD